MLDRLHELVRVGWQRNLHSGLLTATWSVLLLRWSRRRTTAPRGFLRACREGMYRPPFPQGRFHLLILLLYLQLSKGCHSIRISSNNNNIVLISIYSLMNNSFIHYSYYTLSYSTYMKYTFMVILFKIDFIKIHGNYDTVSLCSQWAVSQNCVSNCTLTWFFSFP